MRNLDLIENQFSLQSQKPFYLMIKKWDDPGLLTLNNFGMLSWNIKNTYDAYYNVPIQKESEYYRRLNFTHQI